MHLARQLARVRRLPRRIRSLLFLKITDVVYVLDLATYQGAPPRGHAAADGVSLRPMVATDLGDLARAFGEAKAKDLVARLGTCYGMIATVKGEIAGYSWMTDGPRAQEGEHPFFYDVAPRPGWLYFFDTFVDPRFRGLGLATGLKRGLIEEAIRRGGAFCLATHEASNIAVIRVSEKLGFRRAGEMRYSRVLGIATKDLAGLPDGVRP